jgi:hypothetical protein
VIAWHPQCQPPPLDSRMPADESTALRVRLEPNAGPRTIAAGTSLPALADPDRLFTYAHVRCGYFRAFRPVPAAPNEWH